MSNNKYSLKFKKLPVEMEGESGEARKYEIREMSAEARDIYLDGLQKRMTVGTDGKATSVKNFKGMQADLVSRCLWDMQDSAFVAAEVIQKWPSSLTNDLFTASQEINGLNRSSEKTETEAKND